MSAPEEVGVEGQHDAVHAVPDEHAPIAPYAFKHRETTAFPPVCTPFGPLFSSNARLDIRILTPCFRIPQTRIKKIMLSDNEVGKIKKESPALLGASTALCLPFLGLPSDRIHK